MRSPDSTPHPLCRRVSGRRRQGRRTLTHCCAASTRSRRSRRRVFPASASGAISLAGLEHGPPSFRGESPTPIRRSRAFHRRLRPSHGPAVHSIARRRSPLQVSSHGNLRGSGCRGPVLDFPCKEDPPNTKMPLPKPR